MNNSNPLKHHWLLPTGLSNVSLDLYFTDRVLDGSDCIFTISKNVVYGATIGEVTKSKDQADYDVYHIPLTLNTPPGADDIVSIADNQLFITVQKGGQDLVTGELLVYNIAALIKTSSNYTNTLLLRDDPQATSLPYVGSFFVDISPNTISQTLEIPSIDFRTGGAGSAAFTELTNVKNGNRIDLTYSWDGSGTYAQSTMQIIDPEYQFIYTVRSGTTTAITNITNFNWQTWPTELT